MLLEGQVAVVSGIGPGMGRDISLTLAGAGADLVLAARSKPALASVASEVQALGRRVAFVQADVTDPASCAVVAAAATRLGGASVLVNNAFAEEDWHTFEGFDPERWRLPFDVNVHGTLQLTQVLTPQLIDSGRGSVVTISTLSTRVINPVLGGYSASKRALETACRVVAKELGPKGVRVNCVAPGHIWGKSLETYFAFLAAQRGVTPQDVYDEIAARTALNKIPTSEEISRAVLFFASDLSRVITGQTLDVNCGRTLH